MSSKTLISKFSPAMSTFLHAWLSLYFWLIIKHFLAKSRVLFWLLLFLDTLLCFAMNFCCSLLLKFLLYLFVSNSLRRSLSSCWNTNWHIFNFQLRRGWRFLLWFTRWSNLSSLDDLSSISALVISWLYNWLFLTNCWGRLFSWLRFLIKVIIRNSFEFWVFDWDF